MPETLSAISIRHLTKSYGRTLAVDDLSLEVAPGEIFTYLGPNGAGKTTTIKTMTGLLRPTAGSASILGVDIQKDPVEAKRLIGYIPDRPYLYEKLTGADFCHFVGDLFGMDRGLVERRMRQYFQLFDLVGSENDFIENYSHGMRQKLVFSVSMMHDPRVLIVDEPMVGLDPSSARTLKSVLRRKSREENVAVFLSTHTLSVAEEVADRIGVLHRGKLIFCGSLEEMHEKTGGRAKTLEEMFLRMTGGRLEAAELEGQEEQLP